MSDVYNANSNKLDEEQSEADQAMEIISGVANQQQSLSRYPNLPYTNQIQEDEDEEGAFSHDSVVVESGEARNGKQLGKIRIENEDNEEVPSNPRGFFYNFDYPVQLILENSDDRQQRSIPADQKTPKKSENDKSELNSSLEAEVAEYKIVKRSENSKDAGHIDGVSGKDIEKNDKAPTTAPIAEKSVEIPMDAEKAEDEKKVSNPIKSNDSTRPKSNGGEAQIPVFVKVESEEEPSDLLLKSEMELRRLATNEDVIDAVHDVQIHRHVHA